MRRPFSKRSNHSGQHTRPRRRRAIAAAASATLLLGLVTMTASTPASAAGNGVLGLTMTPVDASNGNSVITDAQNGTGPAGYASNNTITYLVQYSCGTAACDNTQVQLSTPPADPNGLLPAGQFILQYDSFAAGTSGGTISGSDASGKLVDLGDLAAGTSGTFSVTYTYQTTRNKEVPNGSFYPEGSQIAMSADVTSDTGTAPKHANAADVTWHLDAPNGASPYGPTASLQPSNGTFRPGESVNLAVAINGGNMVTNPGANVAGSADRSAVGNYTYVYHVPAEATIEAVNRLGSPDPDAVIDNVAHTVTWTKGSAASPVYGARGGWGLAATSGFNSGGAAINNGTTADTQAFWAPRLVQVKFDGSQFPGADASGCNFPTADIQTTLDASVTYLDSARTTKTIDDQKMNAKVACVTPFGGLAVDKDVAGGASSQFAYGDGNLGDNGAPGDHDVYATNVPASGEADLERIWRVTVSNLGNVPGVAIVDEPDLVQDHLKVHQIYPNGGYGATVVWTADDGTGTITSGTTVLANNEKLDAPAGGWFVSAKATTDPIDPGRVLPGDNTHTDMFMNYRYGVDDGAIPFIGQERTNTAHVTMTYPGYGTGAGDDPIKDLQGDPLTVDPTADGVRTVRYTQPSPQLLAAFDGNPVAAGGAPLNALVPGTEVTWKVNGSTDNVWPGTQITPQLMFIAPEGWDIIPGSAELSGAAPAGVVITYDTKSIDGVTRDIAIATWPGPVTPGTTTRDYYGTMTVKTKPLPTAPAATLSAATVVAGDASGNWSESVTTAYLTDSHQFRAYASGIDDSDDLDGDGNTTESLALTNSGFDVRVTALPALDVTKEICEPDTSADGCNWVTTGAASPVAVPDNADIKYRVTLKNSGNIDLTNAVAEDVLPYDGDSRGSQFDQTLTGTEDTDAGLALDYSTSTSPGSGDWNTTKVGAKAVRLQAASLAIGDSLSTVLTAAAGTGAGVGKVGCNTLKVQSGQTISTTTPAVCAKLFSVAPPTPALGLVKSADLADTNGNSKADVGEKITYTFIASNTGNVDVDDVSIDDNKLSDAGVAVTPANADIGTSSSKTFTSQPYTVTQADVDAGAVANAATAQGTYGGDDVKSAVTKTSTPTPDRDPGLSIVKSSEFTTDNGTAGKADKDDVLKYSFMVKNTGNVTLTGVTVADSKVSSVSPASVTLAPGDSQLFTASYTVTQDDVNTGQVYNIATAKGTSPLGAFESDPSDNRVDGLDPAPVVTIKKSAAITTDNGEAGKADKGDVITYTFTVHNAGPGTAYGVSVSDPLSGLSAISPGPVGTLDPGDDAVFTATYTVRQSDVDAGEVTNQATGHYTPPDTDPGDGIDPPELATPPSDLVVVKTPDPDPELKIVKSSHLNDTNGNGVADVGEKIDYSFDATNTGNVTLHGVHVVDPRVTGLDPVTATLAPTDHQVFTADPYTVTQADVDAGIVANSAVAKGNVAGGAETTSPPDANRVKVPDPDPKLTIKKYAALSDTNGNGTADKGEKIIYSFEVTNTGNVTLADVTVHDSRISGLVPDKIDFLAPKDSFLFTADPYVVTAKDVAGGKITNVATASGTPPIGASVTSPRDKVTTDATVPSGGGSGNGGGGSSLPGTGSSIALGGLILALGMIAAGVAMVSVKRREAGKHIA